MFYEYQTIYLNFSDSDINQFSIDVIKDSLIKLKNIFSDINVEFTLEEPLSGDFSTMTFTDYVDDGRIGNAEFDISFNPSDNGSVDLGEIFNKSHLLDLNPDQISNVIANNTAHEIGHLMGLNHYDNPSDIMHQGINPFSINKTLDFSDNQIAEINFNAHEANYDGHDSGIIESNDIHEDNYQDQDITEAELVDYSDNESNFESESDFDIDSDIDGLDILS